MVYTRLRVILVAGVRYVPFLLYAVPLGVIPRSLYTSAHSTANVANVWGSIALLISEVDHRIQTNE